MGGHQAAAVAGGLCRSPLRAVQSIEADAAHTWRGLSCRHAQLCHLAAQCAAQLTMQWHQPQLL
jgi:hypothetical protein